MLYAVTSHLTLASLQNAPFRDITQLFCRVVASSTKFQTKIAASWKLLLSPTLQRTTLLRLPSRLISEIIRASAATLRPKRKPTGPQMLLVTAVFGSMLQTKFTLRFKAGSEGLSICSTLLCSNLSGSAAFVELTIARPIL